jgi:hypothetical protein
MSSLSPPPPSFQLFAKIARKLKAQKQQIYKTLGARLGNPGGPLSGDRMVRCYHTRTQHT